MVTFIRSFIVVLMLYGFCTIAETVTEEQSDTTYVTAETFEEVVLEAELPVLLDFTAEWCVPCKLVDPIVDELVTEMEGRAVVAKLDIDDTPQIYQDYRVNGIPTVLFFNHGVEEDRISNPQSKEVYLEYLEGMIAGKSAFDITMELMDSDEFRRHYILTREIDTINTALEHHPQLLIEKFINGQTPLSLILNRPSVRQNQLIALTLSMDPEISPHDLVGLGQCEEFSIAVKEDSELVNRLDPDGNSVLITALMRSNRLGENDCTQTVLQTGLDLAKQESPAFSLSRAIILRDDVELVSQMLEMGWDAQVQDDQGYTALHWAAMYGQLESVQFLLEQGVDHTLKTNDGKSVIEFLMRSQARAQNAYDMIFEAENPNQEHLETVSEQLEHHTLVLRTLSELDAQKL